MAPTPENQDWRTIAARASKEMDDEKLLILVQQLCDAFDASQTKPAAHTSEDENQLRKPTANSQCQ